MNQDERDEISEIAQKIVAHIEGAQTHSVGMLTYDSICRAGKRLDMVAMDVADVEKRLFGLRPAWVIIDELGNVEPIDFPPTGRRSLDQQIMDDLFNWPTPVMEEEPKGKKAKWKQDKSPFGRLNQSRKAKGL